MEQDARFERDVRLSNPVATSDATRRRRILFFNTWSTAHGGSATSLIDIASNLDAGKFEPLVLCPEPGELTARLEEAGIPVVIHPLSSLRAGETRRFVAETGTTPHKWLTLQRVLHARTLLEETSLGIEEIATASGFGTAALLRHHFFQSCARRLRGP